MHELPLLPAIGTQYRFVEHLGMCMASWTQQILQTNLRRYSASSCHCLLMSIAPDGTCGLSNACQMNQIILIGCRNMLCRTKMVLVLTSNPEPDIVILWSTTAMNNNVATIIYYIIRIITGKKTRSHVISIYPRNLECRWY